MTGTSLIQSWSARRYLWKGSYALTRKLHRISLKTMQPVAEEKCLREHLMDGVAADRVASEEGVGIKELKGLVEFPWSILVQEGGSPRPSHCLQCVARQQVAVQEHAAPVTFARFDDDVSLDTPFSAETALCRRCSHQRHSAQWRPRHALWLSRKLESGWT